MDNKCLVIPQYGCSVADLYHLERNHQGKGNELLTPLLKQNGQKIHCQQRLGGLLKFYARAA
jgi:hypothetical protein